MHAAALHKASAIPPISPHKPKCTHIVPHFQARLHPSKTHGATGGNLCSRALAAWTPPPGLCHHQPPTTLVPCRGGPSCPRHVRAASAVCVEEQHVAVRTACGSLGHEVGSGGMRAG